MTSVSDDNSSGASKQKLLIFGSAKVFSSIATSELLIPSKPRDRSDNAGLREHVAKHWTI